MASTLFRPSTVAVLAVTLLMLVCIGAVLAIRPDVPSAKDGRDRQGVESTGDDQPQAGDDEGDGQRQADSGGAGDGERGQSAPTDAVRAEERESSGNDGMRWSTYRSGAELTSEAASLLDRYRSEGVCLLRHAGYLDLLGHVWCCVVEGPGWTDLCVVSEQQGMDGCQVRTARVDDEGWEVPGD